MDLIYFIILKNFISIFTAFIYIFTFLLPSLLFVLVLGVRSRHRHWICTFTWRPRRSRSWATIHRRRRISFNGSSRRINGDQFGGQREPVVGAVRDSRGRRRTDGGKQRRHEGRRRPLIALQLLLLLAVVVLLQEPVDAEREATDDDDFLNSISIIIKKWKSEVYRFNIIYFFRILIFIYFSISFILNNIFIFFLLIFM